MSKTVLLQLTLRDPNVTFTIQAPSFSEFEIRESGETGLNFSALAAWTLREAQVVGKSPLVIIRRYLEAYLYYQIKNGVASKGCEEVLLYDGEEFVKCPVEDLLPAYQKIHTLLHQYLAVKPGILESSHSLDEFVDLVLPDREMIDLGEGSWMTREKLVQEFKRLREEIRELRNDQTAERYREWSGVIEDLFQEKGVTHVFTTLALEEIARRVKENPGENPDRVVRHVAIQLRDGAKTLMSFARGLLGMNGAPDEVD